MTSVERLDEGSLREGSRARVVQPRQRPAVWRVRSVEPPHTFVWEATVAGLQLVAGHHLTEVPGGTRTHLVLDVLGSRAPVVGRLAAPMMRRALAIENDGFRRTAEGLVRPPYVDDHNPPLEGPVGRSLAEVRALVDDLLSAVSDSRALG